MFSNSTPIVAVWFSIRMQLSLKDVRDEVIANIQNNCLFENEDNKIGGSICFFIGKRLVA